MQTLMNVLTQELVDIIKDASTPLDHTTVNALLASSLILEHVLMIFTTIVSVKDIIIVTVFVTN